MKDKKKAIVLCSGGLDSSVTLVKAIEECDEVVALTIEYGQRHSREIESAKKICKYYNIKQNLIKIDLNSFKSYLIKKIGEEDDNMNDERTYVPSRNIIFLSIAAGLCESINYNKIYIGANIVDYSGYPDCTEIFFKKFQEVLNVGLKCEEGEKIKIETPILNLSKKEIIILGLKLGVPLELTWSCYLGGGKACGKCESCKYRLKGFSEAEMGEFVEYIE